jgi:hypothetical protein
MTSVDGGNGRYRSLEERMTSGTNFGEFHDLFYKKGSRPLGEGWYNVTCFVRCISPSSASWQQRTLRVPYCMSTWQILMPRDSLGMASPISWPNYLQAVMSLTAFFEQVFSTDFWNPLNPENQPHVLNECSPVRGRALHFRELEEIRIS